MTLYTPAQDVHQFADDGYEPDVGELESDDDSYPIDSFDLVSSPNDFNTKTLVDFIESGVVNIPGFQRNFIWDVRRASRLIESIIVGLPVPQIFLYEQSRDKYLVIDGQQRLMSVYYFVKGRFPRKDQLVNLRMLSDGRSVVPSKVLTDGRYFTDFRLSLPENVPGQPNRFHRRTYDTLDDQHRSSFDLRTIRHIIVRQVGPAGDSAMYEIFNRLNSGGVNLTPQEIRRCTFDSRFYDMLYETNAQDAWRKMVGKKIPDIHMKDVEILLRGFAMLLKEESYRPSMVKFLNGFSQEAKSFDANRIEQMRQLLASFLASCKELPSDAFHSLQGRFSPMIFESVFVAVCREPYLQNACVAGTIDGPSLDLLKDDPEFRRATQSQTTSSENVKKRLSLARALVALN